MQRPPNLFDPPMIAFPMMDMPELRQRAALRVADLALLHGAPPAAFDDDRRRMNDADPRMGAVSDAIVALHAAHPSAKRRPNAYDRRLATLDESPRLPHGDVDPTLRPAVDAIAAAFGDRVAADDIARAMHPHDPAPNVRSCVAWFKEGCMHTYVQRQLAQAAQVWTGATRFVPMSGRGWIRVDLDQRVIATWGCQLLVFACAPRASGSDARARLIETLAYARRLGGPAAYAALVSVMDRGSAQDVEEHVAHLCNAHGHVHGFHQDDLKNGLVRAVMRRVAGYHQWPSAACGSGGVATIRGAAWALRACPHSCRAADGC